MALPRNGALPSSSCFRFNGEGENSELHVEIMEKFKIQPNPKHLSVKSIGQHLKYWHKLAHFDKEKKRKNPVKKYKKSYKTLVKQICTAIYSTIQKIVADKKKGESTNALKGQSHENTSDRFSDSY